MGKPTSESQEGKDEAAYNYIRRVIENSALAPNQDVQNAQMKIKDFSNFRKDTKTIVSGSFGVGFQAQEIIKKNERGEEVLGDNILRLKRAPHYKKEEIKIGGKGLGEVRTRNNVLFDKDLAAHLGEKIAHGFLTLDPLVAKEFYVYENKETRKKRENRKEADKGETWIASEFFKSTDKEIFIGDFDQIHKKINPYSNSKHPKIVVGREAEKNKIDRSKENEISFEDTYYMPIKKIDGQKDFIKVKIDKNSYSKALAKRMIFGDHDVNPGNFVGFVDMQKPIKNEQEEILYYPVRTGIIDFGHAFNDLKKGGAAQGRGTILDFINADKIDWGKKPKLHRDYEGVILTPEFAQGLRNAADQVEKSVTEEVVERQVQEAFALYDKYVDEEDRRSQELMIKSMITLAERVGSPLDPKIIKAAKENAVFNKDIIRDTHQRLNKFVQTNAKEASSVANLIEFQVLIDAKLKSGEAPAIVSKEMEKFYNLKAEEDKKYLQGKSLKDKIQWVRTAEDKSDPKPKTLDEYIKHRSKQLAKLEAAKIEVSQTIKKPKKAKKPEEVEAPIENQAPTTWGAIKEKWNDITSKIGNWISKQKKKLIPKLSSSNINNFLASANNHLAKMNELLNKMKQERQERESHIRTPEESLNSLRTSSTSLANSTQSSPSVSRSSSISLILTNPSPLDSSHVNSLSNSKVENTPLYPQNLDSEGMLKKIIQGAIENIAEKHKESMKTRSRPLDPDQCKSVIAEAINSAIDWKQPEKKNNAYEYPGGFTLTSTKEGKYEMNIPDKLDGSKSTIGVPFLKFNDGSIMTFKEGKMNSLISPSGEFLVEEGKAQSKNLDIINETINNNISNKEQLSKIFSFEEISAGKEVSKGQESNKGILDAEVVVKVENKADQFKIRSRSKSLSGQVGNLNPSEQQLPRSRSKAFSGPSGF